MYMTIQETSYWYETYGEGETVVLLHGFTGTARTWANLLDILQDAFHIVTLDLPGHGRTKQGSAQGMTAFCHDLGELLDQLGVKQAHLVGYSLGGRAALSFAMLYSERVTSLTLESASPGLNEETARKARRMQDESLAKHIEQAGLEAFVNYWEGLPLFASQKQLPEAIRKNIRVERLSHAPEGLSQSLRYMGTAVQPSWWDKLHLLQQPVLLMSGALDQKFIELNKAMAARLPDAYHKVIEDAGHAIHVEQPAIVANRVRGFLKSCSKHTTD